MGQSSMKKNWRCGWVCTTDAFTPRAAASPDLPALAAATLWPRSIASAVSSPVAAFSMLVDCSASGRRPFNGTNTSASFRSAAGLVVSLLLLETVVVRGDACLPGWSAIADSGDDAALCRVSLSTSSAAAADFASASRSREWEFGAAPRPAARVGVHALQ